MNKLTQIEKGLLVKLFNRGGYVLNFSTNDFDVFTMSSVGVALCDKYKLSKGKSLMAFISEENNDEGTMKLLKDLFDYYTVHYEHEYSDDDFSNNSDYKKTYFMCKEILDRVMNNSFPLHPTAIKLKNSFSSEYLSAQIDLMLKMQSENPTEAIGKAKELVESCCKTILDDLKITWDKNLDVGQLARETLKNLKLMPNNISETAPAATEMKSILGNLSAIATNLAALRNPYGSGHGKSATYKGLEERHAKLAVGSSITFVSFLWDTHENRAKESSIKGD